MQLIAGHRLEHIVSRYYLHRILEFSLFFIVRYWINFTIRLWERKYSYRSPCFELIYIVGTSYEGWIGSKITLVHKGVLVIT